jgi:uncharacterized membrane protein (Fun14 family)
MQYALHAVVLIVVAMSPGIWSSPVYYLAATNGILYVNWLNFQDLLAQPELSSLRVLMGMDIHRSSYGAKQVGK